MVVVSVPDWQSTVGRLRFNTDKDGLSVVGGGGTVFRSGASLSPGHSWHHQTERKSELSLTMS